MPKYYCPECGTWYDENVPFCTGPGESNLAHKAAFVVEEGSEVPALDEYGKPTTVTVQAPEEAPA